LANKTNENDIVSLYLNSNNNTKKNFFLQVKSENQKKFISNSNNSLKNDFIIKNKNYSENKSSIGIKVESNKLALNPQNDIIINKGFHSNGFKKQKTIYPSFKEISQNKDSRTLNSSINHNGPNKYKNRIKKSGPDDLSWDTNKLLEIKLPNIIK